MKLFNFKNFFKKGKPKNVAHIEFKKLSEDAVIPHYAHKGDIGMDITAIGLEYDEEHDVYNYHTGLAVQSEKKYGVFLFPRSSNRRTSAYLTNSVGVIDSFIYRGELVFSFKNRTSLASRVRTMKQNQFIDELLKAIRNSNSLKKLQDKIKGINSTKVEINPYDFAPYDVGERIGQMVVFEIPEVETAVVSQLSKTIRGENGFGSTGK